ncbi:S1C family serine protease [Namhaeicola litoreus]|uniref:S1C family serine protease n=1 Tax=Namhaeicola litoreus TaxID=1052145 RepID=A0ABW3Y3J3_9FLAO
MRNTFQLLLASVLGGMFTLGCYFLIFPQKEMLDDNNGLSSNKNVDVIPAVYSNLPRAEAAEETDFTVIAESSVNAVVHVKNVSIAPTNPLMEFFYGSSAQGGQMIVGTGSGVIISPDGYIITNNHVINGAKKVEVTLNNKKTYDAEIVGVDKTTDIALLKINAGELPSLGFGDSDNLKVGEWVLAVGNPYNLTSTVTAGIVSAKARDIRMNGNNSQIESFIQTDAAVNPGNSGGALVNVRGELIGINTAISSQTGSYVGYSFAVPSNIAKKVIEDILEFGNVQRAYLGINYDELDSEKAEKYGVSTSQGVIITRVADKGAASEAGLKDNDVIVKMDNVKINKFADLQGFLGSKRPGDKVKVTVLRDNQNKQVDLVLKNQFGKESFGANDFSKSLIGDLKPLSSKNAQKFDLDYGMEITSLNNKTLYSKYGIENGDMILAIEDQKIQSEEEVEELLRYYQSKEYINVLILKQNGTYGYVRLRE